MCAGKPMTEETPLPPLPPDVEVVLGAPGDSCTAACGNTQRACAAGHFPLLNSCNQLRQRVHCEAGCGPHSSHTAVPSYTISTAEKGEQPTFCWINDGKGSSGPETIQMTCGASSPVLQRLCPCISLASATPLDPLQTSAGNPAPSGHGQVAATA